MTIEDVAQFLRVHPLTIERWLKEGTLRDNDMVTEEAITKWLDYNSKEYQNT